MEYSLEFYKKVFSDAGCKLLVDEIPKGKNSKVEYQCSCGNKSQISLRSFRQGNRCGCGAKREGMKRKFTLEFVKSFIQENGFALLSKIYTGATGKLLLKCPNGHKFSMRFHHFRQGHRCRKCYDLYKNRK